MKIGKWRISFNWFAVLGLMLLPFVALADEVPAADMSLGELIAQAVADWGSVSGLGGTALFTGIVALVLRVLLSTMKVSILRQWLWDKLPDWSKWLVAPVVGVVLFALTVHPFSLKLLWVGLASGAGAVVLHELLSKIEALPGINATVKWVVALASKLLGGAK